MNKILFANLSAFGKNKPASRRNHARETLNRKKYTSQHKIARNMGIVYRIG